MDQPRCSIEACQKRRAYKATGWCGTHYARWKKHGTPTAAVRSYTKQSGTCRGAACDRPAARKGCCQSHYQRMLREGEASLSRPLMDLSKKLCTLEGCERLHVSRGYCSLHYSRWQKKGDPGGLEFQEKAPRPEKCQGPDCSSPVRAKGYCPAHYRQWREGQDLAPKRPQAPAGTGYINKDGYRVIASVLEHRTVMKGLLGRDLLSSETVHHVNGVRHDNRSDGPLAIDERGRLRSGNLELWSHAHPRGQEIGPKLEYARGLLALYGTAEEQERYGEYAQYMMDDVRNGPVVED